MASFNETVQFNDQLTFCVYTLSALVLLNGPGDVLIGIANRADAEGFDDFPATIDVTASAGRFWAASYLAGDVPVNLTLPVDEQWDTIETLLAFKETGISEAQVRLLTPILSLKMVLSKLK